MNSLNIQLTTKLRRYVDARASDHDVYANPSEFIRDLIRKDMEKTVMDKVRRGLDAINNGQFSDKSVLDIAKETLNRK